jgi:Uncharacterised BCR, YnfA/UPF0060 family
VGARAAEAADNGFVLSDQLVDLHSPVREALAVFIVGSLLWGVAFDGFHPDRSDVIGAEICLLGVAVIMYGR